MASLVAAHDEIRRGAIEGHHGYVFSTGGDGFAAAFSRAADVEPLFPWLMQQTRGEALRHAFGQHHVRMNMYIARSEGGTFKVVKNFGHIDPKECEVGRT